MLLGDLEAPFIPYHINYIYFNFQYNRYLYNYYDHISYVINHYIIKGESYDDH